MLKSFFFKSSPESFFVKTSLFFAFVFLILTPPFQTPDSFQHFYRIYQLSQGQLFGIKKGDQAGGYIPYGLKVEVEKLNHIPFKEDITTSFSEIFSLLKDSRTLSFYEKQSQEFVSFPNTILYPPPSHFPQLFAFIFSSFLDLTVYQTYYFICFFKALFCLFIFYLSIKMAPLSVRWALVFFALIPMNIFLLPTLSPDSLIVALSFLLFSFAMHASLNQKNLFIPLYFLTSFLVAFSKIIYVFIPFVVYCRHTAKKRNFNYKFLILLTLIVFIPSMLWSVKAKEIFVPLVAESLPKDPTLQWNYILSQPVYLWNVLIETLLKNGPTLLNSLVGTFGWMDARLPSFATRTGLILLLAVSVLNMGSPHSLDFNWKDRILAMGIVFGTFGFMFLSLLFTATVVGGEVVHGLQGRYFLGLLPFLLILSPRITGLKRFHFLLPWMVRIGAFFLFFFSIYSMIDRFYLA